MVFFNREIHVSLEALFRLRCRTKYCADDKPIFFVLFLFFPLKSCHRLAQKPCYKYRKISVNWNFTLRNVRMRNVTFVIDITVNMNAKFVFCLFFFLNKRDWISMWSASIRIDTLSKRNTSRGCHRFLCLHSFWIFLLHRTCDFISKCKRLLTLIDSCSIIFFFE